MALLDNLIAHWKLNESSGTRNDSHGANHLTDNNTVGSATGKLDGAAQFVAANSEYLSRADNADLSTGDVDFTLACWVYLDSKNDNQAILVKDSATAGDREYTLYYDLGVDRFVFVVFRPTDAAVNLKADNFGAPSTGTWYFVTAWHDAAADQIGIAINAGTADTVASGGALQASGGAEFRLGASAYSGFESYLDGRLDSASLWKRVLTAQERTDLYNSGNGLDYPFSAHRLALLGVGA